MNTHPQQSWLSKHFCLRWNTLRSLGDLKYFGISYLVLIGVPLLAELKGWLIPVADFHLPATLKWIYFASFAFAVAFTVFQIFCPTEIKRFHTYDAYLDNAFERFSRAQPQHRVNIVLAKLDPHIDSEIREKLKRQLTEVYSQTGQAREESERKLNSILEPLHADAIQKHLISQYEDLDERHAAARIIVTSGFLLGLVILVIQFLQRSYFVLVS